MKRSRSLLLAVLLLSGGYLYAFPSATLPYALAVLLHLAAGVALTALLILLLKRGLGGVSLEARLGWILLTVGAAVGVGLIFTGALRAYQPWLYAHIGLTLVGVILLIADWSRTRGWLGSRRAPTYAVLLLAVAGLAVVSWAAREWRWQYSYPIQNPAMPPTSMDAEGDGASGPFFPGSVQTAHGGFIPSDFFLRSDACQRCHADIFEQWSSSAHRFSSFNNQWYRKSIEYMQEVVGTQPSKWCGGCHDPAVLLTEMPGTGKSRMDFPIKDQIFTPESQAGLGCVMCHSIAAVKSTMGQNDYILEYPRLHDLAASENPLVRALHDFLVEVNPEPHRRTFMKPFVRQQTAAFCSTCHKVHLDVPVNHYRWIRGFNEYDNWQASGVSGEGARSFYYPAEARKCVDCHMPLVASHDAGNSKGYVHSHRFPAANTALPVANQDATQLEVTEQFLKNNIVSVDIFALSPARPPLPGVEPFRSELATAFAVGEEAELVAPTIPAMELAPVTAPLDRVEPIVRRGDTVRVDVVVRTRTVGHFFPGGTVDAFDLWLELVGTDEKGRVLFWSGRVEGGGRGPVEKGAHFYRSLMVDAHGNPINKRNAWATRSLVYVRLIPPGAADTVHYRVSIPEKAGEKIKLTARLHYRKFAWWNTQFSFAGMRDPAQSRPDVTPDYDDGRWVFAGDTAEVSGKLKRIPDLPIITLAEDEVTLRVLPRSAAAPEPHSLLDPKDWERWNDYGIGLLLQGDLKGAEAAFTKATEVDPNHPDGWVNIGRVRVQEGNLEGAREVLQRALTLSPKLARAHFFFAKVLRSEGRYEEALKHLRMTADQYPRDRVVRNEIGRILFLERRYDEAVKEFQRVLAIDPEDLQAHYNLMLCYTGLGRPEQAREHQQRYLRFKADESSQTLTGPYRQLHPEDNNERQPIHEHVSVRLGSAPAPRLGYPGGSAPSPPANQD